MDLTSIAPELAHKTPEEVLIEMGCAIPGHFVLKGKDHSDLYLNKALIRLKPIETLFLTSAIADHFNGEDIDFVVAPATGGISFGDAVTLNLNLSGSRKTQSVFAEKNGEDQFQLKRGYDKLVRGKRVLIVDDILTSGKSICLLLAMLEPYNVSIVGIGVIWNRGNASFENHDLKAVVSKPVQSWSDACPLCEQGIPINTDLGHGTSFVEEFGQPVKK